MYNDRKAQQMAAGLLSLAPSNTLSKLALIKLMYIADRAFVEEFGATISGDVYFSLDHGPVLSNALNAINDTWREEASWSAVMVRSGNYVSLVQEVELDDLDELSDAEARVIAETAERFMHLSASQLRRLSHQFPEWQAPQGSRIPIDFAAIARGLGMSEDQVQALVEERQAEEQIDRVLTVP